MLRISLVAVLAFKAVYTLEAKRRDNEKKVTALYTEYVQRGRYQEPSAHYFIYRMKDMMTVLIEYALRFEHGLFY